MVDGVVQWFDEATGVGRIVHKGQRYECPAEELPESLRVSGSRVHFDISRHGAQAVNVTARGRGHSFARNVVDISGPYSVAARRGTEQSAADVELYRIVKPTPTHLAGWWATSLVNESLEESLAMYSPTAVVHTGDGEVSGLDDIRTLLEASKLSGCGRHPGTVRGDGDDVVLIWDAVPGGSPVMVRLRIEHGEIAAQWFEGDEIATSGGTEPAEGYSMQVVTRGRVGRGAEERATEKVRHVVRLVGEPVLFARVKLTQLGDPAATHPAIAEATLDVNGEIVRAHASSDLMMDAIDALERRLEDRLRHHRERRDWIRPAAVPPEPGEWRHGNLAGSRTPFFDRPREEREVVRHKSWAGDDTTVDEAACDLEALDHSFHLFHELTTGRDSVLSRLAGGGYVLQQLDPDTAVVEQCAEKITLDPRHPPSLTVAAAIDLLDLAATPFVFFENSSTGRGNVAYRRYDGHYGLISPDS